ncbi:MAG: ParA family protein [Holosporales bacterium]|nr:ParA family protein [Holosporales bacterium]
MRTICFANQKGGVGKTTTCVNIAGILTTQKKKKVLLVDADPQCSATTYFLDPAMNEDKTITMLFGKEPRPEVNIIHSTRIASGNSRLDLVPGGYTLGGSLTEIAVIPNIGIRLRDFLKNHENNYDYCLIDCPPDIGFFTMNAFMASEDILVPIQPERLAVWGVAQLVERIAFYQEVNPVLKILGVFTSMFQAQFKSQKEWNEEIKMMFPNNFLGEIHRSALYGKAWDQSKLLCEMRVKTERPYRELVAITNKITS